MNTSGKGSPSHGVRGRAREGDEPLKVVDTTTKKPVCTRPHSHPDVMLRTDRGTKRGELGTRHVRNLKTETMSVESGRGAL